MEAGWFSENVCECESLIWYFFNLKCIFVIYFCVIRNLKYNVK